MSDVRGPRLEDLPGYRRVDVTVVLHTYEMVPEDWDDEQVRFYIEENHCLDNYITRIHDQMDADPNHCQTCSKGGNAFVGKLELKP